MAMGRWHHRHHPSRTVPSPTRLPRFPKLSRDSVPFNLAVSPVVHMDCILPGSRQLKKKTPQTKPRRSVAQQGRRWIRIEGKAVQKRPVCFIQGPIFMNGGVQVQKHRVDRQGGQWFQSLMPLIPGCFRQQGAYEPPRRQEDQPNQSPLMPGSWGGTHVNRAAVV